MLDGDEWVINGQKVWTTQGHYADYCFLLTRTDPDAPKHKGISYLLVPMKQPGVEVRGITQPDGTAEFCEVFFTDARCPKDNVVGGVNNGWKVANSTLAFERGMSATTGYRRFEDEHRLLVEEARANGSIADPLVRQRLMEYYTKIQILRVNGLRSLSATLNQHEGSGRRRARRVEQAVLVGDAPGGDGARARHLRRGVDARVDGARQRFVAGLRSGQAPPGVPDQPDDARRSSSAAPRRSGAGRARSSATSSASGCSGCRRSRCRRDDAGRPRRRSILHVTIWIRHGPSTRGRFLHVTIWARWWWDGAGTAG